MSPHHPHTYDHHPLLLPLVTPPPSLSPCHHTTLPSCHHTTLTLMSSPPFPCHREPSPLSHAPTPSLSHQPPPCHYTTIPCHFNTNILIFTTPSSVSSHQHLSPHRLTPCHHITHFIFTTPSSLSLHQPLSPHHLTPCHHITLLTLSPHYPPPADHTNLRFPNQWRISIFRARLLQGQGSVKQSGSSKLHTRSKTLVWTFHVPLHYTDLLEIFYHTKHTQ